MKNSLTDLGPEVGVMAEGVEIAFYAGARIIFFPTDDTEPILEYAQHKKARYIAVEESALRRPFIAEIKELRDLIEPIGLVVDGKTSVHIYRLLYD